MGNCFSTSQTAHTSHTLHMDHVKSKDPISTLEIQLKNKNINCSLCVEKGQIIILREGRPNKHLLLQSISEIRALHFKEQSRDKLFFRSFSKDEISIFDIRHSILKDPFVNNKFPFHVKDVFEVTDFMTSRNAMVIEMIYHERVNAFYIFALQQSKVLEVLPEELKRYIFGYLNDSIYLSRGKTKMRKWVYLYIGGNLKVD